MVVHAADTRKIKVRAREKHVLGKLFVPSAQKVSLNDDAMLDTSPTISLSCSELKCHDMHFMMNISVISLHQ